MELEKFIEKNGNTFAVKVSDIVEQNGGAMTWYKIPDVSRATIEITIDASKNKVQVSEALSDLEISGDVSVQNKGETVIKFDCIPDNHSYTWYWDEEVQHYNASQESYYDFLSRMVTIEPVDCLSSGDESNIHFTTDIKFQNYDDSYFVNEHREFDFNPCHII